MGWQELRSSPAASCSPRVETTHLATIFKQRRGRSAVGSWSTLPPRHDMFSSCQFDTASAPSHPARVWPLDQAWGTGVDLQTLNQTLPQNLFAISIFPYAGFLYHLTKSKQAPPLTLFGFYFLLVFVFATIPAGIYAKTVYGTNLANVDFLHGPAEFLLTLTNLFIVLGLRQGIRKAEQETSRVGEAAEGTIARSAPSKKQEN